MSVQVRSFGNFSNMKASMSMTDWYNEADSQFDAMAEDVFLSIAVNVIVQYSPYTGEYIAMARQIMRRGLGDEVERAVKTEMGLRRTKGML